MALAAGDRLGPYEILEPLATGPSGNAYKARDTRCSRDIALQVEPEPFSENFSRAARDSIQLNHPHIRVLYDVGPNYLVTEWIDGVPLKGPLSLPETLRFAIEICDALEHGHQRGITHGDLNPSNILVTPQGIKLLNFGLPDFGPQATGPQAPPRTQDAQADLHAFGSVLYEMLMGRPLPANRRPVRPAAIENVLQKCLERDPARGWQSAAELKQALHAASQSRGYRREYLIGAGSVVMLLAGLALLVMQFPSNQKLSNKDILVLADFTNTTGDAIFDGTLRTAFALQLAPSPFLKILSEEQIERDLTLMGRPPGSRITNAIAHDICRREGGKAMINGAIADLGKTFVITVQTVNCQNGATLARAQMPAVGRDQVLAAVSTAAAGIRARLGEPPSSIRMPSQGRLTGSLDALKAYDRGQDLLSRGEAQASLSFLKQAIALDPNFIQPHLALRTACRITGGTDETCSSQ